MSRQFSLLADCLDENGFMETKPDERNYFIETLGKTACRMKSFTGCARQPSRRVFFPNNRSNSCEKQNKKKELLKALTHYKDFHKDLSKKIVGKIVVHI